MTFCSKSQGIMLVCTLSLDEHANHSQPFTIIEDVIALLHAQGMLGSASSSADSSKSTIHHFLFYIYTVPTTNANYSPRSAKADEILFVPETDLFMFWVIWSFVFLFTGTIIKEVLPHRPFTTDYISLAVSSHRRKTKTPIHSVCEPKLVPNN